MKKNHKQNIENELAHSFNIVLDDVIAQKIVDVQKEPSEKFGEMRKYDPSPHLSIATKFMGQSNTDNLVGALKNEFQGEESWELEFAGFAPSETGSFIFLNLSDQSRQKVFELHRRAFEATKDIGYEGHGGLPPEYPYDPHISIIKSKSDERNEALKLINKNLSGVKMKVKSYVITRQDNDENGFIGFHTIYKIDLK